jgi:chromosome segregation ATPase
MSTVTELLDRKTELEGRIGGLEEERASLINNIAILKERLTNLELERHASTLAGEVEALRTEKAVLEEKVVSYESPSMPSEGYQV